LQTSHVLPAMIRKFHEAKIKNKEIVELWGTGEPKREFLYIDDLADACVYFMENLNAKDLYDHGLSTINIGTGKDLLIAELAQKIAKIVGFIGEVAFDTSKPDGTPRKLLNVSYAEQLGWKAKTMLELGLRYTYDHYLKRV